MKRLFSTIIAQLFLVALGFVPEEKRARVLGFFAQIYAQRESSEIGLRFLLELDSQLYHLIGMAASRYGHGIHPKHILTQYHHFFIEHIKPKEKVLDIGCGNAFLAYDIVTQVKSVRLTGIDLNEEHVAYAHAHYQHPNLNIVQGDALIDLPEETFNVVILSNVLEHFEQRVTFLKQIQTKVKPKRFLIRVPLFDRDWRVPLKQELGLDYRLDSTHFVEYTEESFGNEMKQADLSLTQTTIRWGEIWAVAEPTA